MLELLFSIADKFKKNFIILRNIFYLKNIKPKYLFFSECKNYQKYAYLLIDAITSNNSEKVFYVSSDEEDKFDFPNVENYYIGKGILMEFFFLIIKTKYLFLTITDLDNHKIKKTKKIEKYIHYFHAAVSTTKVYTSGAFDNFDIILCNGDYQLKEIRKREMIKKIREKQIIQTGYFYLDYLKERINNQVEPNEILIAPSWNYKQKNFMDENNFEEIIQFVLNEGHIVKFRPHPESFKRSIKTINKFKKKFSNEKFVLDESPENINSMEKAKCLITDRSGIAVEFILMFKKPVLYFEGLDKIHNTEFDYFKDTITLEQKLKDKFGYIFFRENIKDLDHLINKSISEFVNKDDEIGDFINKNFYNYGKTKENFRNLIIKEL